MSRAIVIALAVFAAGIVLAGLTGCGLFKSGEEKEGQIFCPVSGTPAKKECSTEYRGIKIHFSDAKCIEMFNAKPEKFLKIYKLVLDGANQRCPVSGKTIDPDYFIEHNGKRVYFTGEKDMKEFQANPLKFENKLEDMQKERLDAEPISAGR